MGLFFLGIVLFECHLLDEKWQVARDRVNFVASRTYSVLLVAETETQNGKHRLKAFIDLWKLMIVFFHGVDQCKVLVRHLTLIELDTV